MRIAQACGLGLVGVDFRLTEVNGDVAHAHPSLLEINLTPGLRMHHYPGVGTPRNVAGMVLDEILRRRAVWKKAEQQHMLPTAPDSKQHTAHSTAPSKPSNTATASSSAAAGSTTNAAASHSAVVKIDQSKSRPW